MKKYTEEEILGAYQEFNNDRDRVSSTAHERVMIDFLQQNQSLKEFLSMRKIYIGHLYCCLRLLDNSSDLLERRKRIEEYCKENEIFFDKYDTLDYLFQFGQGVYFGTIEEFIENAPTEEKDETIEETTSKKEYLKQKVKSRF